jgi:hypothetical protein
LFFADTGEIQLEVTGEYVAEFNSETALDGQARLGGMAGNASTRMMGGRSG